MTRGLNTSSVLELPVEIHQPGKMFLVPQDSQMQYRGHILVGIKFISFFLCVEKGTLELVLSWRDQLVSVLHQLGLLQESSF